MTVIEKDRIIIEARNRPDMERQLDTGMKALLDRAYQLGDRGILVTRLSHSDYLIELDRTVPFGTTIERCQWSGHGQN